MSHGRGGAGNIAARGTPAGGLVPLPTGSSQASSPNAAPDLEANRSPSEQQVQHMLPDIDPSNPPRRPGDYAHTGRGGAGNWYQPITASKSGSYYTASLTQTSAGIVAAQTQKAQWAGRGGAGNFQPAPTDAQDGQIQAAAEVSKQAERDVEMGLPKPAQAFLVGRQKVEDLESVIESARLST